MNSTMQANPKHSRRLGLRAGALALALLFAAAGCKKNTGSAEGVVAQDMNSGADPAAANMAPANESAGAAQPSGQVLGARSEDQSYTQQGESYQNGPAPIVRQAPSPDQYAQGSSQDSAQYDTDVDAGAEALAANDPPPPLPVYQQPEAPGPDYLWTPGYWSWGPGGYYWVPGVWVGAPYAGALWTPPYWGFYGGHYLFHHGYWGLHIGFYGGIDYGFGYFGHGYEGGYWNGGHFFYNRAVNRINVTNIHNVYVRNVTVPGSNRVSYVGGRGGLAARPLPSEVAAMHEQHTPAMRTQVEHAQQAQANRGNFYNENHGAPAVAAVARPVAAERDVQPPAARGGFGGARPGGAVVAPNRVENRVEPQGQRPEAARPEAARPGTPQPQPHNFERPGGQAGAQPPRVEPAPQHMAQPPQQPHSFQPQARPEPQQARPEPQQARPAQPEARPQPRPEPQARPEPAPRPQPQAAPHPQPQAHPAPQPHPQPQAHPAPQREERR